VRDKTLSDVKAKAEREGPRQIKTEVGLVITEQGVYEKNGHTKGMSVLKPKGESGHASSGFLWLQGNEKMGPNR